MAPTKINAQDNSFDNSISVETHHEPNTFIVHPGNAIDQYTSSEQSSLVKQESVKKIYIEWCREWSSAVSEAFASMPYDPLMDSTLVRTLWEDSARQYPQKIALLKTNSGYIIGVIPLQKRDRLGWQFLADYFMPYSRFFVRPEYTDAALHALRGVIDCHRVVFYCLPIDTRMLRPEESWEVRLTPTFAELMKQTNYEKKAKHIHRKAENLTLREDDFTLLPEALDCWQAKWMPRSPSTARRKDKLLLGYQCLAKMGRLKTFSLHDGDRMATIEILILEDASIYGMTTVTRDEYRQQYAGVACRLATMEWACANGYARIDYGPGTDHFKKQWAVSKPTSYRLLWSPFGSAALGSALHNAKPIFWKVVGFLSKCRHKCITATIYQKMFRGGGPATKRSGIGNSSESLWEG